MLLATGVESSVTRHSQSITPVERTKFVPSLSDWFTPQKFPASLRALPQPPGFQGWTKDKRTFSLYAYRFALNATKSVRSISLPNNPKALVLSATLVH
jgi:hypothetical protein